MAKKNRTDRYRNAFSGFGSRVDSMGRTGFVTGFDLSKTELEAMFKYSWITRKIIEAFPEDGTREWIDIEAEEDIELWLDGKLEELGAQTLFRNALILSRLYGGAGILIGAIDGNLPEEPLNLDSISEISFLSVFDRHQLIPNDFYSDPLAPDFGKPQTYRLQPSIGGMAGNSKIIHETRVIRFEGCFLPDTLMPLNQYWGESVITGIQQALKHFGVSLDSGALLFQDFVTKVLKMPGLVDLLQDPDGEQLVMQRIQYAISHMSSQGVAVVGENEEFSKIQTPITGLVELMDKYMEIVSSASNIPKTKLFGQQLGKLSGATETTRDYFDIVKRYQKSEINKPIEKLLKILLNSQDSPSRGIEPESWSFKFKSLWQLTEKEQAENRKLNAESDQIYIQNQVVTPEEVLTSRFGCNPSEGELNVKIESDD